VNLATIIARVQTETQHAVQTQAARNDIAALINAECAAFVESRKWDWRWAKRELRVYKDRTHSAIATGGSRAFAHGGATPWPFVALDALVFRASEGTNGLRRYGRLAGPFPPTWRNLYQQESRDPSYGGTAAYGMPDPANDQLMSVSSLFFEEPVATSLAANATDWVIRRDRYILPPDVSEVLGIVDRDGQRGALDFVNHAFERELTLSTNQDGEGTPTACIMDEPLPPLDAPVGTLVGTTVGAGAIVAGVHRYFYVWMVGGQYSAPSNIVSVTTDGTNTVQLTGMDVTDTGSFPQVKLIFRADGTSNKFYYIGTAGPNVSGYTDAAAPFPPTSATDRLVWDDAMAAPRFALRFWPRPAADAWYEVQYLRRCKAMLSENDSPDMPQQYHEYLVNRVCIVLGTRNGADKLVRMHERMAAEKVGQMANRYLTLSSTIKTKKAWSPFQREHVRLGKPTLTWGG